MTDFVSFTTKQSFWFLPIEIDLFLFKLAIFASEIFKDSKGIALNVFANILISVSLKTLSPHYQSGFQLNPLKIGI